KNLRSRFDIFLGKGRREDQLEGRPNEFTGLIPLSKESRAKIAEIDRRQEARREAERKFRAGQPARQRAADMAALRKEQEYYNRPHIKLGTILFGVFDHFLGDTKAVK